ncbi:hypothetical protein [Streptomyces sp. CCM_MD2014]|uniref:hypothetical protein n=1 Tax=Streptomyces sp. CCM_MD2014 TaxID=1561022 RepID=UPI00052A939F|nr:hypothetical protein [Streptomyces sp. CCM_MD2014]AIV35634.1 hypothetical protein NI25_20825 [Streptomyces sp. CCM_MD2014]
MSAHAVRLETAGASVTVVSSERSVTDWTGRYLGPWWNAAEVAPETICAGPLLTATVGREAYDDAAFLVTQDPHTSTMYAREQMLLAGDVSAGVIRGVTPGSGLAYRSVLGTGSLEVTGCGTEAVATATARLAREMIRGVLLRDGWSILHASAVVHEGRVILTLGEKRAGKTTTALALASRHRLGLLANDRVFVRASGDGGVDVLPWPSAAAVGFGLLGALGWFDIARHRLERGESLHPTQDERVTDALLRGMTTPLWDGGRELKAQVWPDQFVDWFGLDLAMGGQAAALVFPRVEAGAVPAVEDRGRVLEDGDFMSGATEDRYPDVFALARVDGGGSPTARREVARRLAELPHHCVVLGHDVTANADFLAKVTGCL